MTLWSGGWCFLLMALFYYVVDYKGWSKGLNWLKIYGMNSITAYTLGMVVSFSSIATSLLYGFEQYTGVYYGAIITFANFLILFFILRLMYRQNYFVKRVDVAQIKFVVTHYLNFRTQFKNEVTKIVCERVVIIYNNSFHVYDFGLQIFAYFYCFFERTKFVVNLL